MGVVGTEQHHLHNIMKSQVFFIRYNYCRLLFPNSIFSWETILNGESIELKTGTCEFVCVGESRGFFHLRCLQPDLIVEEDEHAAYLDYVS